MSDGVSYSKFVQMCNIETAGVCGMGTDDLPEYVDPADYWDEGMTTDEATQAAKEFAQELMQEVANG